MTRNFAGHYNVWRDYLLLGAAGSSVVSPKTWPGAGDEAGLAAGVTAGEELGVAVGSGGCRPVEERNSTSGLPSTTGSGMGVATLGMGVWTTRKVSACVVCEALAASLCRTLSVVVFGVG